jgi:hypothetical protein
VCTDRRYGRARAGARGAVFYTILLLVSLCDSYTSVDVDFENMYQIY